MNCITVKLSDWLYLTVLGKEVLSRTRLLPATRWYRVYELVRKHCGAQKRWCIGMLHKKSGFRSPEKRFRRELKQIAASGIMPDYHLLYDKGKDQLVAFKKSTRGSLAS